MRKTHALLIAILFVGTGSSYGEPLQQNASGNREILPLSDLPVHLKAPAERIGLLADFENKKAGSVTLYLVNSTSGFLSLPSQDGDLGCKRESKTADGKWRRCDSHAYSWCGNSYGYFNLPAGHFVKWTQACDTKTGETRPLRFKLYNQGSGEIVSNEGTGIVNESDIQFCRYDSLAMRDGPFEDVAAVATGRVKGGQGASIDGMGDAIRALGRFPQEMRLFVVVQEVVSRVIKERGTNPQDRGETYASCLAPLQNAVGYSLSREELWNYLNGHLNDPDFPWRASSLEWMCKVFAWDKRIAPVLETVVSTSGHPAMWVAAHAFDKVIEKGEAGRRLASIESDQSRPARDRNTARHAREALFPNPFLSIKAEAGEPLGNDGDAASLKRVTFTNISPQKITLPVSSADALLVIEVVESSESEQVYSVRLVNEAKPGSLTLEPGESTSIQNVRWWDRLDRNHIKPQAYYSVAFLARTPGLWDIPTRPAWSWSLKGEKILKAIDLAKE